jgi:hypothetical protein
MNKEKKKEKRKKKHNFLPHISTCVASGLAYNKLFLIVSLKRKVSCATMPTARDKDENESFRISFPSIKIRPKSGSKRRGSNDKSVVFPPPVKLILNNNILIIENKDRSKAM